MMLVTHRVKVLTEPEAVLILGNHPNTVYPGIVYGLTEEMEQYLWQMLTILI
jgi:hypothetical protein